MGVMQASKQVAPAHEAAGFTGRFTAGLRYVESTCVTDPVILSDPLAGLLAGDGGLALANQELEQLTRDQGTGKHLRVPARSRLIDDMLEQEVAQLRRCSGSKSRSNPGHESGYGFGSGCGSSSSSVPAGEHPSGRVRVCQVVSLGAGMCTRPWRLACLADCCVFELDLPHIAATKAALLAEAGAECSSTVSQTSPGEGARDCNPVATAPAPVTTVAALPGSDATAPLEQPLPSPQAESAAAEHRVTFPLLAASYACIGADLSASAPGTLAAALTSRGFDPATPTIWILEALLYYMPLEAASVLLCQLAGLSAPGSRLIATCVDRQLLEASLKGVPKGHIFADLWHFETEALLYDTVAFRDCWQVDWVGQPEPEVGQVGEVGEAAQVDTGRPPRRLPASTRRLAKERLGADTYVALYGGSELLFISGLRQQSSSSPSTEHLM